MKMNSATEYFKEEYTTPLVKVLEVIRGGRQKTTRIAAVVCERSVNVGERYDCATTKHKNRETAAVKRSNLDALYQTDTK